MAKENMKSIIDHLERLLTKVKEGKVEQIFCIYKNENESCGLLHNLTNKEEYKKEWGKEIFPRFFYQFMMRVKNEQSKQ